MKTLTTVERRLQKARTTLLLDHPFFGSLLFRLKGRESRSIKTMATDGISLFYNPDFVDTLNAATLCGVLAHEVLHPGLQHHVRRSRRKVRLRSLSIAPALSTRGSCVYSKPRFARSSKVNGRNACTCCTSKQPSIRSRPSKPASVFRSTQSEAEAQSLDLASSGSTSMASSRRHLSF
jgi:hypothetical protein